MCSQLSFPTVCELWQHQPCSCQCLQGGLLLWVPGCTPFTHWLRKWGSPASARSVLVSKWSHLGVAHVSARACWSLRSGYPWLKPTAFAPWEPKVFLGFLWILVWEQGWLTLYNYIWSPKFSVSCGRNMAPQMVCVVFFLRIWWL